MNKAQISALAKKFLEGNATPEEVRILHEWYNLQNGEADAPEIIVLKSGESGADLKSRMSANIASRTEASKTPAKVLTSSYWKYATGIAAAVALLIVSFYFWKTPDTNQIALKSVTVPYGQTAKMTMPDGSQIWLNAGSHLSYPTHFSDTLREITLLEGEAFFDIKHENKRPFIVHARKLDIHVLGTSFDVKAYKEDENVKVTVKTGKVGVTQRDKPNEPAVMLLPKEQMTLHVKKQSVQVGELRKPAVGGWKDDKLVFEDEPLSEIFKVLERKFKHHISVDSPEIKNEKISITIDNQPLNDILKVISFSKGFRFSQPNDSTTVIR